MTEDTDTIMEQIKQLRVFQNSHAIEPTTISGETCIWCENDTAEVIDEAYGDPAYDREGYTNWARYQCSTCGCIFDMGTKTIEFSKVVDNGKPELSVDMGCFNCWWNERSPSIGEDGIACTDCETEPNGQVAHSSPTAHSNWKPMKETE